MTTMDIYVGFIVLITLCSLPLLAALFMKDEKKS